MKAHRVVPMLVAMCTVFSVLAPAVASAQAPPACALADFALLGEASTFSGVASADSVYLKARLKAGRSYVAIAWAPIGGGPLGEDDADLSIDYFTDSACTTAATTVSVLPATAEPSVTVTGHTGARSASFPRPAGRSTFAFITTRRRRRCSRPSCSRRRSSLRGGLRAARTRPTPKSGTIPVTRLPRR